MKVLLPLDQELKLHPYDEDGGIETIIELYEMTFDLTMLEKTFEGWKKETKYYIHKSVDKRYDLQLVVFVQDDLTERIAIGLRDKEDEIRDILVIPKGITVGTFISVLLTAKKGFDIELHWENQDKEIEL